MTDNNTVEHTIEQALLQEPSVVEVGGQTYDVAPPSMATLIKVSALVSEMPKIDTSNEDFIGEILRVAKDCRVVGEIIATVILGAKRIRDFKRGVLSASRSELQKLTEALLYEKTPQELHDLLARLITSKMDVVFFSNIITSLSAVNMSKPTKTTAPGQ